MHDETLHPELPEHETTTPAPPKATASGPSVPQHATGNTSHRVTDTPDAGEAARQVNSSDETTSAGHTYEVIAGYKVHPLASRFELIVGKEFDDFVEAAARARRLPPVETHNGLLIDGRNRLRAQEELTRRGLDIVVPVIEWEPTGDETVAEHIWAVNAHRRHLTDDQRATLALKFLPAIQAERQARQEASRFGQRRADAAAVKSPPPDGQAGKPRRTSAEKDAASTVGGLAKLAGVSPYRARRAKELGNAVEKGEVGQSELDSVAAGDKRLRDVRPRKVGGKKKSRPQKRTQRDAQDANPPDDASLLHGWPTEDSPLEADIDRFWAMLTMDIPVTEHRDMCQLLQRKIDALKKQHGW